MIAFDHMQTEIPEGDHYDVTVIGVGGAGSNVIDRLALDGMGEAEIVCMNTDIRALSNSMANRKIQLGKDVTKGLGAGGDPELGAEVAEASEEEIRDIVQGRDIIFICVGLGGGTGSGAAPYVARLARESGAFVVVFAIMPFGFEGRRRRAQADEALELLSEPASALLTFENGRMGELVLPKEGIQAAFAAADEVIGQSVRAVTGIVLRPGLIRIGMDDLIRALENDDSRCLFGYGEATGESRAQEALTAALRSPLLERGVLLSDSRNVLVHVTGGKTMTLIEVELLMTELGKQIGDDAQILFGTGHDPKLGDRLAVTVISSLAQVVEPAVEEMTAAEPAAAVGVELAVEEEASEVVEACGDVRNRGSADGVELGLDDVSVDRAPRVERTVAAAAMADIEEVVAETLLDLGMDEAVADRREPEEEEDVVGLEEFVEIEEEVAAPMEVTGSVDAGKEESGVEEPAVEKAVVIEEAEEPKEADEVKVAVNEEVKEESEEAFDPSGECLTEDAGVVGENPGLEDVVVSVEVETEVRTEVRIEAEENSVDGVDIADEMAAVEEKIEAIAAAMGITEAPEAVGEAVSVEQPEALAEALGDDDAGGDEIEVDGDSDRQRGEVASDGREEVAGAREEDVADEIADISAEVTDQKTDYFVSSGEVTREVDEEGIGEVVGEVDEEVVGGVDEEVYDRDEAPTGAGVIDDPVLAETEEESAAEVVYEPYTPSADYGKPVEEEPVESFQSEDPVIEEVDEPALAMAADSGHVDPATAAAVGPRVGLVEPKPSDPSGQGMLELDPGSRGRFDNSSPTVIDGEDLDVPTFLRKRKEK